MIEGTEKRFEEMKDSEFGGLGPEAWERWQRWNGYAKMREQVPEHDWGGIFRWIESGVWPGSFLSAVIKNNLAEAIGKADRENRAAIQDIVGWFYNYAPSEAWDFRQIDPAEANSQKWARHQGFRNERVA